MRQAHGICLYNKKTNQIYNFTIHIKNDNIVLMDNSKEREKARKYNTFQELYKSLLTLAKNNNYYFPHYNAFGVKWYDISFIDMSYSNYKVEKYGFSEDIA